MSSEEKTPYHSVSGSISQMTTQKQLGLHYIKVEGTMGNQKSIVIRNENDVAEITDQIELADLLWEEYKKIKAKGIAEGAKFIEVEKQ